MQYEDDPVNVEEVTRLQHLDEQIEARLRGNTPARPDDQDALDRDFLHDLRTLYQSRALRFQCGLDRVWGRLEQQGLASAEPRQHRTTPIPRPGVSPEKRLPLQHILRLGQRWPARASTLVATALLVVLVGGLILGLILVHHSGSGPTGAPPSQTKTPSLASFTVSSVDLVVNPDTIDGTTCGSSINLTYTATFHLAPGGPGGRIQFAYTLNNGRSSTIASVIVSPGQTTATYTFTSSGVLLADHTYPGTAEIMVTSPNVARSPQVQPSGSCITTTPFQVTSVDMEVSPTSIADLACGTQTTVTYTATFHLAPGGPGGAIQFEYTTNNGRSSTNASITVTAGQATATYSFSWSGQLPADHTSPGLGGVMVSSPNQVGSPMVAPTGSCG